MRCFDCEQNTDEWYALRAGKPTASRFDKIITPAKGTYSSASSGLIASLIAEQLPGYERAFLSNWVERGHEMEPRARAQYIFETDFDVTEVGFVMPDDRDDVGCSPDSLVQDGTEQGLLEIKCPKVETLIEYHLGEGLPREYKSQVQGQMWVTGLPWCDFYAWHPELAPYVFRVERDEEFIGKLALCVDKFIKQYTKAQELIKGV